MLNLGISEIVLIIIVGCLVTDPKKMPGILRTVGAYYRKFQEMREEVVSSIHEVCNTATDDEPEKKVTKQIVGSDGKLYEAYNVDSTVRPKKEQHNAHPTTAQNGSSEEQ